MKRIVRTVCTGCHTASFPLQHRFDEAGWNAIIELMKNANVYGTLSSAASASRPAFSISTRRSSPPISRTRAAPAQSDMHVKLEPRPSGEAARVMFKEYDVPLDPDANLPANFVQNDGSDWSLGTPSVLIPGWGVHDSWLDLSGNLWFTCNIPNKRTTIGRIDTTTGAVKLFKVAGPNGLAAQTHGMTRDPNGIIWFNINNGRGGIGRLDPATQQDRSLSAAERHDARPAAPPRSITTAKAISGRRRRTARCASIRSRRNSPSSSRSTYKTANGTGITYGTAADRDGNGYWAEMMLDTIGVGDGATGARVRDQAAAGQVAGRAAHARRDANSTRPTVSPISTRRCRGPQGPRRMGTDKNADVLWVGNSWGANLARIDTHTHAGEARAAARRAAALSRRGRQEPRRLDQHLGRRPGHALRPQDATRWTAFDLPTRGAEPRYVSLLERDGQDTQVVLPYFRARKVAVMTLRSRG